ncbi:N-acetyltransferase [Helicobacter bilis]|uniref:N-acetyltransferase n=2 Tax=Helicobacter bilis TaxID=37372 RepID=A0A6D2CDM4_9HELI|nr:GNAT family N-acetyltransferase [Helicobacter bilis]EMZ41314.1 hypothetical protein C826_00331 [Helicobacter bilis WiWa]TLE04642.1 N-acetyltransferase [Helicobacter bilis]TLE05815.1 N-acetyltransferase [Helicobacter bilis]
MAQIIREEELQGKYVNLREITLADAAFVVALRCSPKAKFLNPTKNDVGLQEQYIENYFKKNDEWYFIVEDKQGKALGTIRIHNAHDGEFGSISWIMSDDAKQEQTLEGEYLLKHYAYHVLGFNKNCFEVRKANKKVVQYHKFCGSRIVGETDIDYLFELTKDEFDSNKHKLLDLMEIYAKD